MQGKRASRISAPSKEIDHGGGFPNYLTPSETGQLIRISARTLANWRSQGKGPAYRKVGGRVVYKRESVMDWSPEIKGFGSEKPRMTITTRPYHRDSTRSQVDIMFPHPATSKIVRRRLTAPKGFDPAAAKIWGEQQVKGILRELFQGQHAPADEDANEREAPKNKTPKRKKIPTVGEYWLTFEANYIPTLKYSSQAGYSSSWKHHLKAIVQDTPLDQVDRIIFAKVKAASKAKKHDPSTTNQIVNKLTKMLKVAEADGVIPSGVIPKIQPEPEGRKKHKEVYSPHELGQIIIEGKRMGQEHHLLALLLVYLGLRIGEAAGLHWSDIDFGKNEVTVQRNICKGRMQDSPKGEIGTLRLHKNLRAALLAWKAVTPYEGKRVFAWTDRQAELRACTLEEEAGLIPYGPHRIRHSVITDMVDRGKDPYEVQAFARHAKFSTTMEYYNHSDKAKKAARVIDSMDYGDEAQAPVKRTPRTSPVVTGLAPRVTTRQIERRALN